jgi:hypothetical protein
VQVSQMSNRIELKASVSKIAQKVEKRVEKVRR